MKRHYLWTLLISTLLLTSCEIHFTFGSSSLLDWDDPVTSSNSQTETSSESEPISTDVSGETPVAVSSETSSQAASSEVSSVKESSAVSSKEKESSSPKQSSASSSQTSSSSSEGEQNYYLDEDPITDKFNYKTINNTEETDAMPSKGDLDILVIPVEFTDYKFVDSSRYASEEELDTDLDNAFNGSGETDTGYWESLSSFYSKSSFDNLNMTFEIAPIYSSTYSTKSLKKASTSTVDGSTLMLRNAVGDYKSTNGDDSTKKFDSDGDGFIDAVMLIYSCHNTYDDSTLSRNTGDDAELYWAYCYWDYNNYDGADVDSPIGMSYFWCSYDFFYRDHGEIGVSVDTHTIIHETGHLMGLDDYYTYDSSATSKSYVGFADMMEGNIYDHDVFSKAALGWVNPYIVTGDCTITINPSQTSGDCIILADDYNGTIYDEFLMLELFTADGLNYLDSHTNYADGYPICFSQSGVKLFHVDSRITSVTNTSGTSGSYFEPTDTNSLSSSKQYFIGASNSTDRDYGAAYNKGFDLIRLINQNKKVTPQYGSNANLFETGDTFSLSSYSSQFPKKTTLNNGKSLDYTISFDSVSDTSATITFTKTTS